MAAADLLPDHAEGPCPTACPSASCGRPLDLRGLDGDTLATPAGLPPDRGFGEALVGRCGECGTGYDFLALTLCSRPMPFEALADATGDEPTSRGGVSVADPPAGMPGRWNALLYDLPGGGTAEVHLLGPLPSALARGEYGISRCAGQRDAWSAYDAAFAALAPALSADLERRALDRERARGPELDR